MKTLFLILFALISLQAKEQTIVLGAGCFWGVEKHFENLKGVKDAISGYSGGSFENPTYEKILSFRGEKNGINHAEVVKVIYDDSVISTKDLLKSFWQMHDPTQKDRQGNDIGSNYRSIILYTTDEQKELALKTKDEYQKLLNRAGYGKITTQIQKLKRFYRAEEYHQDYLKKHPFGYCPNHSTGVVFKKAIKPLNKKEIVVVTSKYCIFCKKFENDVIKSYKDNTPLRVANAKELEGFKLKGKIVGTPTILFVENGKESFRHTGYLSPKEFYKMLDSFKKR